MRISYSNSLVFLWVMPVNDLPWPGCREAGLWVLNICDAGPPRTEVIKQYWVIATHILVREIGKFSWEKENKQFWQNPSVFTNTRIHSDLIAAGSISGLLTEISNELPFESSQICLAIAISPLAYHHREREITIAPPILTRVALLWQIFHPGWLVSEIGSGREEISLTIHWGLFWSLSQSLIQVLSLSVLKKNSIR